MGNIGMVGLRDLALKLQDTYGLNVFVETGTYKAQTTTWAAENFEQVYTVEAYRPYFEAAAFKHVELRNVKFAYGDSRQELKRLLAQLTEPALIYLDAHWMGNMEESLKRPGGECPLREELQALNESPYNHFVIIDDARLFLTHPPLPHDPGQWPSFLEVKALLTARHPKFIAVHNDAIIAVPPEAASIVQRMTGQSRIKVAVLASNKYIDCIPAFGYLFNKYWSDKQPVTLVRYDKRPPGKPRNFYTFAIGNQAEFSWSSGLAYFLELIPDEQIILLLEDYYLSQPVDAKRIEQLWDYMESHPEVVKIDLTGDLTKRGNPNYGDGLLRADQSDQFRGSLQAAIWRREYLLAEASCGDFTPWQFEKHTCTDGLILGVREPVLHYVNAVGGEGRRPGELDEKKFPGHLWAELRGRGLT